MPTEQQTSADMQAAFREVALDESPKLTNQRFVTASEYFAHGWNAAIRHYIQQESPIDNLTHTGHNQ